MQKNSILSVFGVLLASGCSLLIDPREIAPEAPGSAGELCQRLDARLVERATECLGESAEYRTANAGKEYSCAGVTSAVAAGRIAFDAQLGATCLEEVRTGSCFALFNLTERAVPAACVAALKGQVAAGAACRQDLECAAGFCDEAVPCTPGPRQCKAWATTCQTSAECERGKVCVGAPGSCRPMPILEKGASCVSTVTGEDLGVCGQGLWCDRSLGQPKCVDQRTSGPCVIGGGECLQPGYLCTQGIGEGTPTCKPVKKLGETCGPGHRQCVRGAHCARSASGLTDVCQADPRLSGTCGATAGDPIGCLGSWCSANVCAALPGAGSPCAGAGFCAPTAACAAGQCQALYCQ